MQIQTQVGPVSSNGLFPDGSLIQNLRAGRQGDLIGSDLNPRYFEQTFRRNNFTAYAGGVVPSLAVPALTGLILWNGTTNINASLNKVCGMLTATAATCVGLVLAKGTGQSTAPSAQTAITAASNDFIGGAAPQCTAMTAGTFSVAPVISRILLHNTAAIATTGEDTGFQVDIEGGIIIPPQCYVAICAIGAAGAGGYFNLSWTETPAF